MFGESEFSLAEKDRRAAWEKKEEEVNRATEAIEVFMDKLRRDRGDADATNPIGSLEGELAFALKLAKLPKVRSYLRGVESKRTSNSLQIESRSLNFYSIMIETHSPSVDSWHGGHLSRIVFVGDKDPNTQDYFRSSSPQEAANYLRRRQEERAKSNQSFNSERGFGNSGKKQIAEDFIAQLESQSHPPRLNFDLAGPHK